MKNKPRFIAIVTPAKEKPFKVFDRLTGESFAETRDRGLAKALAAEYSEIYPAPPWYARITQHLALFLRPSPPVALNLETPPPIVEPWQRKIRRINALVEQRKKEMQLANGGRIVEPN